MQRDEKGRLVKGSGGRKKGAPNKVTHEIREAFEKLLKDNLGNMSLWLTEVAAESPEKALDIMAKFAEFTTPKLQRQEVKHEIPDTKEFSVTVKK